MAFPSRRAARLGAAFALSLALACGAAACGFNVQTLQPYTPAEGVNLDVGQAPDNQPVVKVRNLMILSREAGTGFLSASLVADQRDALVGLSGTARKVDGSDGAALTVQLPDPIALGNGVFVVLTDRAPITVSSPDLKAGQEARLILQFSDSGDVEITVPVVDANQREYQTVTPQATPSS